MTLKRMDVPALVETVVRLYAVLKSHGLCSCQSMRERNCKLCVLLRELEAE
tara:strand:- start:358 stop:510 length:153 start_codon:yes stop_codon:yes gene_type:complete